MDRREYVCNQMYKQHALLRKDSWTDADRLEYMELNIAPYSKYWRMGMKKALKHAIKLLREEEAIADRKTEPQMGDAKPIPLSNRVTQIEDEPSGYNLSPVNNVRSNKSEIPTGSTVSKMEQVEDEPQKERSSE